MPPSVRVTVAFCHDAPLVSAFASSAERLLGEVVAPRRAFDRLGQDLAVERDLDGPVERGLIGDADARSGAGQMIPLTSLSCQVW